ncbi:SpoIIE family protein phosphatase [Streptomyces sp. MI02-7b]|uniref:SpoIIE family protein phosphatase n=1 Tax=Streptomyces sp. MI02-7b TaxID=462941 RepID=UPI0029A49C78|nr:SpoIIE family protein phosphatase [Streptomyces sp. MI02-7b]MDX3075576.1 SpoIIE family protein phosphatase [Streptomyces sp. MI02-7b]
MRNPAGVATDADGMGAVGPGPELIDPPLLQVTRETGASMGLLYVLDPADETLRLTTLVGGPQSFAGLWARIAMAYRTPVSDAVRDDRLVWLGGPEDTARTYPRLALVLPYDFALAAAPITSGGRSWGGLVLFLPGARDPQLSLRERSTVRATCHRIGVLLREAADQGCPLPWEREPRKLSPLRARLHGPGEALAAAGLAERLPEASFALDLDGRFTFVTRAAARLLGAEIPVLLGSRPWNALPWLGDPLFEDSCRGALISLRPSSLTTLRPPDHWLSFELYPDPSGISARVTAAPAPVDADTPAARLPEAAAKDRAVALYHLLHLAATLTEAVGVQDVIDQVMEQMLAVFGVQGVSLLTAEGDRLRIIGYRGYTEELMAELDMSPLTMGHPAVRVMRTGVPGFFATVAELRRFYPAVEVRDTKAAWAFLPLIASGRPVGTMVLAYDRPHPFPPGERSVLTSIAGLIAQALDRARLYDAEHDLAITLQARLLPRALPEIPGLDVAARYVPATQGIDIGGDFYDVISLGAQMTALTIGDVQGHNVNAAALMGEVRTAVRATAGASPSEVLARSNRLLVDLDPGLLTSCVYAHLDLARNRAHLATAGHPPVLLRRPGGGSELLRVPPGPLLGVDRDARYPTIEIPLPPGTLLVLYTDGLVEARGVDLDEATAALADHVDRAGDLSLDELADALVGQARSSAPRSDDIALLLTRVT